MLEKYGSEEIKEVDSRVPLFSKKNAGFIGFTVSEKYGGAGGSISQMAAIVEELARGDVSMALPVRSLPPCTYHPNPNC